MSGLTSDQRERGMLLIQLLPSDGDPYGSNVAVGEPERSAKGGF